MLPKIEISTAEFFPAKKISQIINDEYGEDEGLHFKYIENTEAMRSWDKHNYIKIADKSKFGRMVIEKTETTHILIIALKILHQYSKATGELGNVG